MTRQITHRDQGAITTTMSDAEAAAQLSRLAPENHWLWFHIHKMVNTAANSVSMTGALNQITYMFLIAIGHGRKKPKISAVYGDTKFTLYLSKRGSLCFKAATRRQDGHETWNRARCIGWIYGGQFTAAWDNDGYSGRRTRRDTKPEEMAFINALGGPNPANFLAQCSRNIGVCCYCNLPLSVDESKTVGYGKVCAGNWGLPWGKNVNPDTAPSFARIAGTPEVQRVMDHLLEDTQDEVRWRVLDDLLQENGIARFKEGKFPPAHGVVIPTDLGNKR